MICGRLRTVLWRQIVNFEHPFGDLAEKLQVVMVCF